MRAPSVPGTTGIQSAVPSAGSGCQGFTKITFAPRSFASTSRCATPIGQLIERPTSMITDT